MPRLSPDVLAAVVAALVAVPPSLRPCCPHHGIVEGVDGTGQDGTRGNRLDG